jgi:hypothetical protein
MEQKNKKVTILLWIIAFIITILSAYYQRVTGPTYPLSGSVKFQGKDILYKLERSGSSNENCIITLQVLDENMKGVLLWKRYKTNDDLSRVEMVNEKGELKGELPKQPPAGKLEYYIRLISGNLEMKVPPEAVMIRFKGDVPLYILVLHIAFMFAAMLLSARAGVEIFRKEPDLKKFAYWTLGLLTIGGLIFGPLMEKYAFGEYWTGVPFGFDLTDNKTLIVWLGWIVTIVMIYKSKKPKYWVLGAALLMLVIFLIPHSVLGS